MIARHHNFLNNWMCEWKKIEFPKRYYIWIWKQQGWPRNRWQDEVRGDGRLVGGKGWKERVCNREEWKTLLRMARNRRILHMPMEWMNDIYMYVWLFHKDQHKREPIFEWTVHVITVKRQISHADYHSLALAYSWSIIMWQVNSVCRCIVKCFSIHQIPAVTDPARLLSVPRRRSVSVSRTSSHLFSKASLDSTKICSVAKAWWWWRIWILSSWRWSRYSGWSWSRKPCRRRFPSLYVNNAWGVSINWKSCKVKATWQT